MTLHRYAIAPAFPEPYTDPTAAEAWQQAEAELVTSAQRLARLIADTLTAMLPEAAYLVLTCDDGDELELHSLLSAQGFLLWDFIHHDDPLPALPPDSPLGAQWPDDPRRATTLLPLLAALRRRGMTFDHLPEQLAVGDVPRFAHCLLLSPTARPARWAWDCAEADIQHRLRPYPIARRAARRRPVPVQTPPAAVTMPTPLVR